MKKFFVLTVVLCVGLFVSAVMTANAEVPVAQEKEDIYTVQEGDTLWVLEGEFSGRPAQWNRLLELNLFLRGPGRVWVDGQGRTIVLIKPGEELRGLKELGIVPNPLPLDQLRVLATPVPPAEGTQPVKTGIPWWVWVLFAWVALGTLGFIWTVLRAIMSRDPVAAGPAMVNGVNDQTVTQAFGRESSSTIVKNVERGRVYGAVQVHYGDGSSKSFRLNGQAGYKATVSWNNGKTWNEEYMLQACGNDLRMSGMRYVPGFGFRFVLETVVEEQTTQTPAIIPNPTPSPSAPTAKAPTPEPATGVVARPLKEETATTPTAVEADESEDKFICRPIDKEKKEGEKKLTFRPETKGRPNLVESEGIDSLDLSIKGDKITIRFS